MLWLITAVSARVIADTTAAACFLIGYVVLVAGAVNSVVLLGGGVAVGYVDDAEEIVHVLVFK